MDAHLDLEQALSYRLVLVITTPGAGPGSGIAPLLAVWRRQSTWRGDNSIRIVRLVLEEAHNSSRRFIDDLQSAVVSVTAGHACTALENDINMFLNSVLGISEEVILVLENYHVIHEPEIHSAVSLMLDYLPPRLHLAIVSQYEPPLPIPRLRARRQMLEIRI